MARDIRCVERADAAQTRGIDQRRRRGSRMSAGQPAEGQTHVRRTDTSIEGVRSLMRFLHTGDWHIGKMLKGRNRLDEQTAVLTEIVDIARRESVDGLLLGGDVFDSFSPGPEAERLVYAALAECCGVGIPVVVIGGNHDHPRRLAALRELLDPLKIYVRAEPCRSAARRRGRSEEHTSELQSLAY